jgi:hypothetical protein
MADANSHMPCHGHEKLLSERHGHGMACVIQIWLNCVNQTGKTQSKPLAAWQGNGMVCVN